MKLSSKGSGLCGLKAMYMECPMKGELRPRVATSACHTRANPERGGAPTRLILHFIRPLQDMHDIT